jgi:polo-like kinase 1
VLYHSYQLTNNQGGFAKCYYATCVDTNKEYALKIVAKSSLLKPKSRQKVQLYLIYVGQNALTHQYQLQSEIKIHQALRNEYVVRFDRFFEDRVNAYIRLELCTNNVRKTTKKLYIS